MHMKNVVVCLWFSLELMACGNRPTEHPGKSLETQSEPKIEIPKKVEVTLDQLVGTWEYAEARIDPKLAGIKPIGGTILLGFTKERMLAFATDGKKELTQNLDFIPSEFEIKDNEICATDTNDVTFKMNFLRPYVPVFLINENELILGKGKNGIEPGTPSVYQYYTKVK